MTRSQTLPPTVPLLLALLVATVAPATSGAAGEGGGGGAAPRWHERLEPALAAARDSDRPVLVDLYAEWCGWCHKLEAEVFSTARFADFARDFVLLRVDVEDAGEGGWLRDRLGVATLPTLAIVDADLVRIGLVGGYAPTDLFLLRIERALVAYEAMHQRDLRRAASDDREVLAAVGRELLARQDGQAAAAVYSKLLAAPDLPSSEQVEWLVRRADAERLARRYEEAADTLAEARARLAADRSGGPRLDDALDLGILRLAHDRGGCTGVETLEAFVRDRATSRHVSRARSEIAELKAGEAQNCS
ncbi:MAG TPA: thioredoxin family protein [Thermoanaerobaculia bacterium]|nr:thioredoxin family protein [Thermoanaerobaculia bacterium]